VTFVNNISSAHMFAVDPTLHFANPNNVSRPVPPFASGNLSYQFPVPLIPHLHGGETQSDSDGHPEAWWTFSGLRGRVIFGFCLGFCFWLISNQTFSSPGGAPSNNNSAIFRFPNQQPPGVRLLLKNRGWF
jgi:hypothetical protein